MLRVKPVQDLHPVRAVFIMYNHQFTEAAMRKHHVIAHLLEVKRLKNTVDVTLTRTENGITEMKKKSISDPKIKAELADLIEENESLRSKVRFDDETQLKFDMLVEAHAIEMPRNMGWTGGGL